MPFPDAWSRFPVEVDSDPGRNRRRRRRRWCAALAFLALGVGVWRAWLGWSDHLVRQGMSQVELHLQRQEWHPAELLLAQNYAAHPLDPRVLRTLARFQEALSLREALIHRRTINKLLPASDADWIATAKTALQFREGREARAALARVSAAGQAEPECRRTAAALAFAEGDLPGMIRQLEALHREVPADVLADLNLQLARLDDPRPATREEARTQLVRLARGPEHRITATLALLSAGRRADSPESFARIARRLFPGQQFTETEAREALLAHMQAHPAPRAEEVVRLLRYLAELDRAAEACGWLAGLPPALRAEAWVTEAEAGLRADLADWPALHDAIRRGAWGGRAHGAIEAAFAAQAGEVRGDTGEQLRQWRLALDLAADDVRLGTVLVRLAVLWAWTPQAHQALSLVAVHDAIPPATLARLVGVAARAGDTATLAQALECWQRLEPGFPGLADRLVYITALRGRLTDSQRDALAGAPPAASPYRRAAQGLVALRTSAPPARLAALCAGPADGNAPAEARLMQGLLLAAAGRGREAEPLLESVRRDPLLPEERTLLAAVQAPPAR